MTDDVTDRLLLDRAEWALEDTKYLLERARMCLKYYGMMAESDTLNKVYYTIQDVLDKIEDKVSGGE